MRTIEVNGVTVRLTAIPELEARGIRLSEETTPLTGELVIVGRLSLRDLIQIAGRDEHKIDYAVPEDWARQNGKDPMQYVWSYEKPGTIFGEPLSTWQIRQEAQSNILSALVTQDVPA